MNRLAIAAAVGLALTALSGAADARTSPPLHSAAVTHRATALDPALSRRLAAAGPNEPISVIVVLAQQAPLQTLPAARRASRMAAVLASLHATAAATQRPLLQLLERRRGEGRVRKVTPLWIFNGFIVTATPDVVRELAGRRDVAEVRQSQTIQAADALAARSSGGPPEPNVSVVNAPALWSLGDRGQGVVVANMDTGVDATHPDLAASWRGGTNSWFDPYGQHPASPTDVNGHGTWTMGAMVGGDAGGTAIGVAPAAKWIAVKIFNDGGTATTAAIHQGFQWLLDPDGNPSTADAPNVVNNSWTMGAAGCNLEFQLDLRSLRAAGILPVFAAGNGGPGSATSFSPANNPEAFAVGATDNSDALEAESSRGPSACDGGIFPEVVAPGVGIRTTDLYGFYSSETGTSMAAAHVSGALALLLSAFPDLPADGQETALESGAHDLGVAGPDNDSGFGRLDVLAAYNWTASAPDFSMAASPGSATTLPGGTASYTVEVGSRNGFAGDVTLSLSGLSASQASWTFTPPTVAGGFGTVQLDVTTASTLAPGSYQLSIAGTNGSTTHRAPVTLQVTGPPDFTLSASPTSSSTLAGGSVSYAVSAGSLNGFAGDVSLSLSGLSPAQGTWSFSPATIGGAGTSTLTVTAASSLGPATYPLTITGASGTISHSASVNLVVLPPPNFTLSASPGSASTLAGGSVSYAVSIGSLNGFAGTVALSVSGLSAAQGSWSFNPATVTRSGTSTLTVTTAASLPPGTYRLTVAGSSGAITHSASVNLVVAQPPDFVMSVSPSTTTVIAGSVASYKVSLSSKGGFSGSVTLSVTGLPAGATASFSPNPVSSPGSSSLTVRTTANRGTFTLAVTGMSGALVHQTSVTLVVR